MTSSSRSASAFCRKCGYDLQKSTGSRCPECGRPFDLRDPRTFNLHRFWVFYIPWYRFERHPLAFALLSAGLFCLVIIGNEGGAAPAVALLGHLLLWNRAPHFYVYVMLAGLSSAILSPYWDILKGLDRRMVLPLVFGSYMFVDLTVGLVTGGMQSNLIVYLVYAIIGAVALAAVLRRYSAARICTSLAALSGTFAIWLWLLFDVGVKGNIAGYLTTSIPLMSLWSFLAFGSVRDLIFAPQYIPRFGAA